MSFYSQNYFSKNKTNNFFHVSFLLVNLSVIIFFNYRQSISIDNFIGKLITNKIIVQIQMENSVDKSKDCGSVSNKNLSCKGIFSKETKNDILIIFKLFY